MMRILTFLSTLLISGILSAAIYEVAAPGLLSNDTWPSGSDPKIFIVSPPAYGEIEVNADGGFRYTAGISFSGTDQLSYCLNSNGRVSKTVIVNLTSSEAPPDPDRDGDGVFNLTESNLGRDPDAIDRFAPPIYDDFSGRVDGPLQEQPGAWSFEMPLGTAEVNAQTDRVLINGGLSRLRLPLSISDSSTRQAIHVELRVVGSPLPPPLPENTGAALYFNEAGNAFVLNLGNWLQVPGDPFDLGQKVSIIFEVDTAQQLYSLKINGRQGFEDLQLPATANELQEVQIQHIGRNATQVEKIIITELEKAPLSYLNKVGGSPELHALPFIWDPRADSDSDGVANWLEHFQDSLPGNTSSSPFTIKARGVPSKQVLMLSDVSVPQDITLQLKVSKDLRLWEDDETVPESEPGSFTNTVRYIWDAIGDNESMCFWTLNAVW